MDKRQSTKRDVAVQSLAGSICIQRDTDAGAAAGAAAANAAADVDDDDDDDDDDDVSSSINQQSYSVNQFQVLLQHDG